MRTNTYASRQMIQHIQRHALFYACALFAFLTGWACGMRLGHHIGASQALIQMGLAQTNFGVFGSLSFRVIVPMGLILVSTFRLVALPISLLGVGLHGAWAALMARALCSGSLRGTLLWLATLFPFHALCLILLLWACATSVFESLYAAGWQRFSRQAMLRPLRLKLYAAMALLMALSAVCTWWMFFCGL